MSEGLSLADPVSYNPITMFKNGTGRTIWKPQSAQNVELGQGQRLVEFVRGARSRNRQKALTWRDDNISRVYFPAASARMIEPETICGREGSGDANQLTFARLITRNASRSLGLVGVEEITTSIELSLVFPLEF